MNKRKYDQQSRKGQRIDAYIRMNTKDPYIRMYN